MTAHGVSRHSCLHTLLKSQSLTVASSSLDTEDPRCVMQGVLPAQKLQQLAVLLITRAGAAWPIACCCRNFISSPKCVMSAFMILASMAHHTFMLLCLAGRPAWHLQPPLPAGQCADSAGAVRPGSRSADMRAGRCLHGPCAAGCSASRWQAALPCRACRGAAMRTTGLL